MTKYRKSLTSLVGAIVAFATLVITSPGGPVSSSEWLSGAIGLATSLGVYGVSNDTPADERGAVEPGSCALGVLIGGLLMWLILRGRA